MDLTHSTRTGRLHLLVSILLGCAALSARGDEPAAHVNDAPQHAAAGEENSHRDEQSAKAREEAAEEARERKQAYEIGMILLAGIGFLGIFLIAFVLIYSRSVRRKIRAGRKPTAPRDDLWYLKSKSPPADADSPPESDS